MNGIVERYDAFRMNIPYSLTPKNIMVITQGINAEFNDKQIADVLTLVKEFNAFNADNDPWGEHDFGSFTYCGQKIFWKIDNYAGAEHLDLILTIMFASEY